MFLVILVGLLMVMLSLISGFFMLWKIPVISRNNQKVTKQFPSISIVIPVRDEENNISTLLDSLKMQSLQPEQIIVVDDESSDRTVEVASKYDVQIKTKELDQKKLYLTGKTAACYRGAKVAKGDLLIFIDADTYLNHENSLQDIVIEFEKCNFSGLFTLQPYHYTVKFYEKLSAPMNMIVAAGLNSFTPLKRKLTAGGAFGPFLMCSAEEYRMTGGHKKILDSHLDNFMLAKLYQAQSLPVYNIGGKGSVSFRMYPDGPKQWLLGWSKSISSGSAHTHPLVMSAIGTWISGGFILPVLLGFAAYLSAPVWTVILSCFYFFYAAQFLWLARKVGRFPVWLFAIYPILLIAFVIVFTWSSIQVHLLHSVLWRGRKINV